MGNEVRGGEGSIVGQEDEQLTALGLGGSEDFAWGRWDHTVLLVLVVLGTRGQ